MSHQYSAIRIAALSKKQGVEPEREKKTDCISFVLFIRLRLRSVSASAAN